MGPALLFCPASRPERFAKAASRADAVILDLEDGIDDGQLAQARIDIARSSLDPERTLVRLSAPNGAGFREDCAAVRAAGYRFVIIPKCESAGIEAQPGLSFIPQIETAKAVCEADAIAARPDVVALFWGAEDMVRSLGGVAPRDPDGRFTDVLRHVRSSILLSAAAAGKVAIDAPLSDFSALGLQESDARDAARMGFAATACIHPAQVQPIHRGYRPSDEDVAWARRVLEQADQGGAFAISGSMVDAPVIAQARRVLTRIASSALDE